MYSLLAYTPHKIRVKLWQNSRMLLCGVQCRLVQLGIVEINTWPAGRVILQKKLMKEDF